MPAYLKKNKAEILNEALEKLQNHTPITAIGPGSVARALTETITAQLGDMYDILDFNIQQTMISTATGSALDLLGNLYNVSRKRVSDLAAVDKKIGSFFFYLSSPHSSDIAIPKGTNIYTDSTTYMGSRFSYSTSEEVIIPAGRTRVYASIIPNFIDTVYTAGKNMLIIHDFQGPVGVDVFCTNPKPIAAQANLESDDQYRVRIIKEIRVNSGGTLDAVRFAALAIPGVRDVRIRQSPYGMGSFEAIIVPEANTNTNVMGPATEAMDRTRPLGVSMYTRSPTRVPFTINVEVVAPAIRNTQSRQMIQRRVIIGISRYINTLLPGSELVYNRLLQVIMDSSELIKDVIVVSMSINGKEIMRRNYRPEEDEQIILGDTTVSLARS